MKNIFKHVVIISLAAVAGLQAAQPQKPTQVTQPLTVTIEPMGEPSLTTFYKVPVEIKITNNTDKALTLRQPYFNGASVWNKSIVAHKLIRFCEFVGLTCMGVFALSFPVEGVRRLVDIGLHYRGKDVPALHFECVKKGDEQICGYPATRGVSVTWRMFEAILPGMLSLCAATVLRYFNRSDLAANETVTIYGYMSADDIIKVRHGLAQIIK